MGWWEPHWQHTAVIELTAAAPVSELPAAASRYYYQVTGCGLSSEVSSFRPPNVGPQHTLTAVLTADMGATTPDRISQRKSSPMSASPSDACLVLPCLALPCLALPCLALPCLALPCLALPCLALPCLALPCLIRLISLAAGVVACVSALIDWAEADAFQTTANMAALIDSGFAGQPVDLALCVGDLAYATGYLGKWETFMNAIGPVTRRVPYMVRSQDPAISYITWFPWPTSE
jgi:hypothetical protein